MKFNLFMYCTIGRRSELEAGMAGQRNELYQRMLDEIAEYASFADQNGYAGFGHPEHHLQIEGFEISNEPTLMSMWLGRHSEKLRIITCGFVSTTHNPLRTAEAIATLDHMHRGRFGVGLVRGYQARWVENFKIRPDLSAVGNWNKDGPEDVLNREYFNEFVDIVVTALREKTFSYHGEFWQFPPPDFVNPHDHPVYRSYGEGVSDAMRIDQVGIAPRPYQDPHPPLYGGFTGSMRTATFWAKYLGKPIVLASNLEFCQALWSAYREAAQQHGHQVAPGHEAAWGGIMICCPTDAEAQDWFRDMEWFWNTWALNFGQPMPELLVGSPETLTRRIEEASNAFPIEECFLLIPQGIHSREQILSSLDLFSKQVMPNFV
ncbi:MAG: LLM class flavin-dependent oxidoreductase [Gammaproteobacteria bacterium]|jgi:alkanesulfonate monooxygenase SsuD/methylene tetrahydromethanopterin reductase-like flavin-dependent oxidoreductase (luciferase family)